MSISPLYFLACVLCLPPAVLCQPPAPRPPSPADSPAELAARVGSADPSVRGEAEGRLEELGRDALPALRVARAGASAPEASRRLGDLIDLIERKRLLRATTVEFRWTDTPLAEAAADLSRRSGFRLVLDPLGAGGPDPARTVTAATSGPIGFWEALDRLGASAKVQPAPFAGMSALSINAPSIRLIAAPGPPSPSSYAGPYRVDLVGIDRHRQVIQARPGREPRRLDETGIDLQLVTEPGVGLDRNGPPRLLEALGDNGDDLRPDPLPSGGQDRNDGHDRHGWWPEPSWMQFRLPLSLPAGRVGRVRVVRGVLPIVGWARTGPLVQVSLAGAEGRPYPSAAGTLWVRKISRAPDGRVLAFSLAVPVEGSSPASRIAPGPRQLTVGPVHPPYMPNDYIEVLDDQGRQIRSTLAVAPRRNDSTVDVEVTIPRDRSPGPPTTLRYYGVVAEAIEVPFVFRDVPLP